MHGQGTLKFHADDEDERDQYTGRFRGGLFHGKGVLRWRDGLVFTGDFSKGVANGKAKLEVSPSHDHPGSVYVGDYKHNARHGKGKETWGNGDEYEGTLEDGKSHGHGTYTFADGRVYTGGFRQGIWHGRGVLACSDHRDDRHRFSYEGDFSIMTCSMGKAKPHFQMGRDTKGVSQLACFTDKANTAMVTVMSMRETL